MKRVPSPATENSVHPGAGATISESGAGMIALGNFSLREMQHGLTLHINAPLELQ
jgi:hypothetical protein